MAIVLDTFTVLAVGIALRITIILVIYIDSDYSIILPKPFGLIGVSCGLLSAIASPTHIIIILLYLWFRTDRNSVA